MKKMKLNDLKSYCYDTLQKANIENPQLNSELIISHFMDIKRLELNLHAHDILLKEIIDLILKALNRRVDHEPIQYILGETEFYGYRILVDNSVLIPRPETEFLVEKIIHEKMNVQKILEIGTGSGAIAIALAKNLNAVSISATDISKKALKMAKHNAQINNAEIDFFYSDIFEEVDDKFDLIVSNPPYISEQDFEELPIEVKDHEPTSALFAEESGLYFYNKILSKAKEYLTKSGIIYFEIGYDQADSIAKIAKDYGFGHYQVFKDLNGFDRIIRITR